MGCLVMAKYYLQFFEDKLGNHKYEFACDTDRQSSQSNASYFILDLDDLFSQESKILQTDSTNLESQNNMKTKTNQKSNKNIIAGIIYQQQKNVSELIKKFIISTIKYSLYFQTMQYEEGFNNLMVSIQDYLHSHEFNSGRKQKDYYSNYGQVFNLMMKLDDDIFLSKPFKNTINGDEFLKNSWSYGYSLLFIPKHQEIDIQNDLINKGEGYYQIKKEVSEKMKHLILYSSRTKHEIVIKDVRKLYPKNSLHKQNDLFFFKFFL